MILGRAQALLTMAPLLSESEPPPDDMIDYPEIRHMHTASMLDTAEKVVSWRGVLPSESPQIAGLHFIPWRARGMVAVEGKVNWET